MLGSPIPRPGSRNYISRRSMSPVPISTGNNPVHDPFTGQHAVNGYGHSAPGVIPASTGGPNVVSLPLISPAFSTSSQLSEPEILRKLQGRHVINANMFNKNDLNALFNLAQFFRNAVLKDRQLDHILKVDNLSKQYHFVN